MLETALAAQIQGTGPSHGTLRTILIRLQVGIYTPITDYVGTDSFQYTVTDGHSIESCYSNNNSKRCTCI